MRRHAIYSSPGWCSRLSIAAIALAFVLPTWATAQTLGTGASTQDTSGPAKKVSNVFQDTDLKQALSDLGLTAGVPIVPDETVQGNVTAKIKDRTIEQALDILLLPGGYCWAKIGETYLVGKCEPSSPNFLRFATSRIYKPNFATADKIIALLPTQMASYVKALTGERTITITASPTMMERIMRDIKMLDAPLPRIVLEAMVTEADTTTLNQYDLSFAWKYFGLSDSVNTPSSQWTYAQASQSDVATLTAMINKGKATIKASPRVMTLDGKEATIEVGQENYFEVISGPVSYPVATIQLIKTGITLKMTPYLSDDGWITVTLNPEVSDATGSGANGLPINTVRKASTTVRVKNGETIIIGGMTFETKRRSDTKVPFLGDLPLFGSLFRFKNDQTSKQDVIIMVTPRVIPDGADTEDLATPISKLPDVVAKPLARLLNGKKTQPISSTAVQLGPVSAVAEVAPAPPSVISGVPKNVSDSATDIPTKLPSLTTGIGDKSSEAVKEELPKHSTPAPGIPTYPGVATSDLSTNPTSKVTRLLPQTAVTPKLPVAQIGGSKALRIPLGTPNGLPVNLHSHLSAVVAKPSTKPAASKSEKSSNLGAKTGGVVGKQFAISTAKALKPGSNGGFARANTPGKVKTGPTKGTPSVDKKPAKDTSALGFESKRVPSSNSLTTKSSGLTRVIQPLSNSGGISPHPHAKSGAVRSKTGAKTPSHPTKRVVAMGPEFAFVNKAWPSVRRRPHSVPNQTPIFVGGYQCNYSFLISDSNIDLMDKCRLKNLGKNSLDQELPSIAEDDLRVSLEQIL